LLKWLVKEGDFVKKNQPLAELETSKINIQITTLYAGKITLLKKEGDTLNVGDIIATISK
jgi:pyruvate/2-oxoglutarate dehydrogenase complex dihydrolipoamide acyltransferase (E2) component